MRVLVACEESQRVCTAFRERGHEAYSCDIVEPSGGHPEWHVKADAAVVLNGGAFQTMDGKHHYAAKWDMLIAHPPCTYLSNAGACRLYKVIDGETWVNRDRLEKGMDAKEFFLKFWNCDIEKVCIENPIPSGVYRMPKYAQTIQPYEFGDPYSKKTCLWLKGLPDLIPTNVVMPIKPWVNAGSKKGNGEPRRNPGMDFRDGKTRSKTFPGIARAMAEQWG